MRRYSSKLIIKINLKPSSAIELKLCPCVICLWVWENLCFRIDPNSSDGPERGVLIHTGTNKDAVCKKINLSVALLQLRHRKAAVKQTLKNVKLPTMGGRKMWRETIKLRLAWSLLFILWSKFSAMVNHYAVEHDLQKYSRALCASLPLLYWKIMGLYPIKNCIKSLKYYMHFTGISLIRLFWKKESFEWLTSFQI